MTQQHGAELTLLPCPFCGGKATIERTGTVRQSMIVTCEDCGCRHESGDVLGATKRLSWNARHNPAKPQVPDGYAWQDIASAPEDGTVILVYRQDAGIFTAHYVEEDAHLSSFANPPEGDAFWFSTSGEDLTDDMPTHWQPLPAAPSITEPGEKV